MPLYVSLLNWTDEGIRTVKETVGRAKAASDLAENLGGRLKDVYWTIGPYDLVAITEFPDDETATAYLYAIAGTGNIRTTSLRAFNRDEIESVLAKVP
jgi:uncharacterized protein with GYD domain